METLSRICLEEIIRITLMAIIVWVWSSPVKCKAFALEGLEGTQFFIRKDLLLKQRHSETRDGFLLFEAVIIIILRLGFIDKE